MRLSNEHAETVRQYNEVVAQRNSIQHQLNTTQDRLQDAGIKINQLRKRIAEHDLRVWAVEQAVKMGVADVLGMANGLVDFVTKNEGKNDD